MQIQSCLTDLPSGCLRLGAAIIVLSIAADPLNQQLIQYKQRVVYSQDASVVTNRAMRYAKGHETFPLITYLPPGKPFLPTLETKPMVIDQSAQNVGVIRLMSWQM